jgi:hypothetical protein
MKRNLPRFIPPLMLFLVSCNLANNQTASVSTETPLDNAGSSRSIEMTAPIAGDLGLGKISGRVTDSASGMPIAGATVTCAHFSYTSSEADRCNRSITTDQDGNYLFADVFFHDTDTITLTIHADGYGSTTLRRASFTQAVLEANIQLTSIGPQSITTSNGAAIENCPMFPANNIWNARVDSLPAHPMSEAWIDSIGRDEGFHMDFGSGEWDGGPIGIPFNILSGSTVTKYTVDFYYPDESDAGPYPIPDNPLMEYSSDHHILVVDTDTCTLYEIYDASFDSGNWSGGSGAMWNLNSNALRPETWTSADAAGLPILPGLVRYDEILAGEINHAIRFTAEETAGYVWPARHLTSDAQDEVPTMGARFRLKAEYDISGFPPEMQVILQAMKEYGIILADNGSNWYVTGAPDERWDNDMLHLLDELTGNDFEAVDASILMVEADSGVVH